MRSPHLRHFIRTVLPATFSSAIWYFAPQFWQLKRIESGGYAPCGGEARRQAAGTWSLFQMAGRDKSNTIHQSTASR